MKDNITDIAAKDVIVQASLSAIPFVGNSLSTAYFSTKQERRFRRIETFYCDLSDRLLTMEKSIIPFHSHDEESLVSLIERLNEEIEIESSRQKRDYFKSFFINLLRSPTIESNYDERQMLLNCLASITVLEFQTLLSYSEQHKHIVSTQKVEDQLLDGAISRLENLGLLSASYVTETFLGQSPTIKIVSLSKFGEKFIEFCIV
ncbi:hypothetical protein CSV69_15500 [Sporosarcina sp. P26b]|uniref:hypothetical protein n=1 Tax=Sporosarcina sp. P26b TaxID=2048253 RepID=UPI000C16FF9D|nr:hypothetical protein [Sporosarcina sp. P26b]PIC94679.1 hypothetical protein CSV69_15500 [Sporosarcina sp. P26b]